MTVKDAPKPLSALTVDGGSFTLAKASAKDVVLEVSADGYTSVDVPVKAGKGVSAVSVAMSKPTGPQQAATRQVSGLVRNAATNAPVAGATVTVQGTQISAQSDEDGLFTLSGVAASDVTLDISAPDHAASSVTVSATEGAIKIGLQGGAGGGTEPTEPTEPQPSNARTLRGKVTEAQTGEPIPGATVQVVGTDNLAIADETGSFELAGVGLGAVQLEVVLTGYETLRVSAPPDVNEVTAPLKFATSEEIYITGRAPVIVKQNLANGASVVNDKDLNRVSAQTLDTAMTGKVSGANIQNNSGAPGGGTQLRLRGISTINGQSSPLYVIDGVIVSNVAVASGANAVTGAAGGGSASNQDNPVNRIADLNPNDIERVEILKGASAAALYGSKASNGVVIITTKRGRAGAPTVNVTQRVGIATVSNKLGSREFGSAAEVMEAFGDPTLAAMFDGETFDHEAEMTRTAVAYETIASAAGGTESASYSGSVLVRDEPGVVKGTFYEKQSGRLSVNYNWDKKLQVGLTTNLLHSRSDRGLTNNDNTGTSLYVALSSTPSFLDLSERSDGTFPNNPLASSNPLQTVALLQNEEDVWRLIGSATAAYQAWSNEEHSVSLQANFGADRFQQVNDLFAPPELQFEDDDGLLGTSVEATTQNLNYNVGTGALWSFAPKSGALRNALSVGYTYEDVDLTSVYVFAQNLNAGRPNVDSASSVNTTETRLRTRDQGVFLQEEIALMDDQLSLLGGLLAERSSLNGDTGKFYLFPKVAATYRLPVAQEQFETLRVRGAYGEAGNRPNYGQKFTALNAVNTIDGNPGIIVGGLAGDPGIEPERQREFELGVDAAVKDQRIVLELTGYQRNISNLLLQRALPTSTGFTTQFENGGEMRNRGLEAALSGIPVADPVEWTTRFVLTLNRSTITDLPGEAFNVNTVGFGAGIGAYRIEEGKSATQIVSDVDGDGVFDVIGDGEPDFRLGWSNEISIGPIGLFTLVDWQQGSEVVNLTRLLYDFGQVSEDFVGAGEARLESFNMGDIRPYIEDATFVKLREVSVHYDLPKDIATQIGPLNALRFSLSGRNLLTFSDYSGLDPEVSNFGNQPVGRNYDVAPYPPSRSFWLSVDAGF